MMIQKREEEMADSNISSSSKGAEAEGEGSEAKWEEAKNSSAVFDSPAPLMHQGGIHTHLSLLKGRYNPCEIGRSRLAAKLLTIIFENVGKQVEDGRMVLNPAVMGKIHEYCQEIVTLFTWESLKPKEESKDQFLRTPPTSSNESSSEEDK
jgi:hypothetical protein